MRKDKETAKKDFIDIILMSWTWDRLTDAEKDTARKLLEAVTLKGSYKQRYNQLHQIYYKFLLVLGYTPIGWREPNPEPLF